MTNQISELPCQPTKDGDVLKEALRQWVELCLQQIEQRKNDRGEGEECQKNQ